jgi:hypothetical protein
MNYYNIWTYDLISQPKGPIVNVILNSSCMSQVVQHDDRPFLAIVNKVGQLWVVLPMIMNFWGSHIFHDDGLDMIWDSRYFYWVQHNADEWKHVMGMFHTHMHYPNFWPIQAIRCWVFDQVMDLNCFTWVYHFMHLNRVEFS